MLDVNAMDNAAVDAAIAEAKGSLVCPNCGSTKYAGDYCVGDVEYNGKIYRCGVSKGSPLSYTTDRTLTGDMLCGDEANGEPGLWSRHGIALVYKSGWQLIIHIRPTAICYGPFGQGDTDEERKCSAVARAYLLLIDELKGGSAG